MSLAAQELARLVAVVRAGKRLPRAESPLRRICASRSQPLQEVGARLKSISALFHPTSSSPMVRHRAPQRKSAPDRNRPAARLAVSNFSFRRGLTWMTTTSSTSWSGCSARWCRSRSRASPQSALGKARCSTNRIEQDRPADPWGRGLRGVVEGQRPHRHRPLFFEVLE